MRPTLIFLSFLFLAGCAQEPKQAPFQKVTVSPVYGDTMSIRAITFLDARTLAFAGADGLYGTVDVNTHRVMANTKVLDSVVPSFRAVGKTSQDFFMLSVDSPALLFKTGEGGTMELVYREEGEGVFYDSLTFWDDREGIAVGDAVGGCLSIIISRDGGSSWTKLPCSALPPGAGDEGAFAASDTNIVVHGDQAWIGTTQGRVYHSMDRGRNWTVQQTPILHQGAMQGIFSMDFHDGLTGFAIGGDYDRPNSNRGNKMVTHDGGRSWNLIADGSGPGYKSCVQYVPNSGGMGLVALGFTGISYSWDGGENWKELSGEPFYTLRFLNDSTAYAAGKDRIARLAFH